MKTIWLVVMLVAGLGVFFLGRATAVTGIDRETVSDLLRASGDSAVTAFRSGNEMKEFVSEALSDTVQFYDAEVRAATKIVIRRDTIRIQGERIVINRPVDTTPQDTILVALPLIEQNGITVAESLLIQPPPNLLERSTVIFFDPDTIIAAILRTPDGIDRFAAAGLSSGTQATVIDAAQLRVRERRGLKDAIRGLTLVSCVVFGYLLNDNGTGIAPKAVSGGLCAGGGGLQLLTF